MTTKVPVELSSTPGIVDGSNATAITIDSSEDVTLAGHLLFADSKNAKFGAGSDLQIYHDGSDSYIKDSGTGNLLIQGSDIYIGDGTDHFLTIRASGLVGIGTTAPDSDALLHVKGTTAHTYSTVEANSGVTAASKYISGSNAYRVGIDTTSGGADADFVIANTESGGDTRLIIAGDTGTLHNESNVAGVARFGGWNGNALSMADDASITLGGNACGAWHVHIYERGSGAGAVYFADYDGTTALLREATAGGYGFANSDTDNAHCLYKTDNSHTVTFKSRTGSTRSYLITIFGAEA